MEYIQNMASFNPMRLGKDVDNACGVDLGLG